MGRLLIAAVAVLLLPQPGWSQQLQLKRAAPAVEWAGCPAPPAPAPDASADDRAEAERLAAAAAQSAILGDNEASLEQLTRAATLDPNAPAIAYRRARALESLGQHEAAVAEYCRYLALPGADDQGDVNERLAELTRAAPDAVPQSAADAQAAAIAEFDAGRFQQAEEGFSAAASEAPGWGDAIYNRAIVRLTMGQTDAAADDFRRYLELAPGAPDFEPVLDLLSTLRTGPRYNPASAFATGLLLPGLGHFTTGRPVAGSLFLAAAGAAIAGGLMIESVDVACLTDPVDGRCPPDQVLREDVERPYLTAAIGAAAAIGIAGAIDALRGARARNRAASEPLRIGGSDGPTLQPPRIEMDGHRTRIDLLRLRF